MQDCIEHFPNYCHWAISRLIIYKLDIIQIGSCERFYILPAKSTSAVCFSKAFAETEFVFSYFPQQCFCQVGCFQAKYVFLCEIVFSFLFLTSFYSEKILKACKIMTKIFFICCAFAISHFICKGNNFPLHSATLTI